MNSTDIGQTQELVSVIIPIFNAKDTLCACVDSVLQQTYNKLQIILVNDGSTDGSTELCDMLAERDSRILSLRQRNGGVSSARNLGIQHSKGEYIFFLDADDLIHSRAIELLHRALTAQNKQIAVCTLAKIKPQEQVVLDCAVEEKYLLEEPQHFLTENLYGKRDLAYCWGKLWKKDSLRKVVFQEISMCEDVVFVSQVFAEQTEKIVFLEGSPLYFYIQRDDSAVHTLAPQHLLDSLLSAQYLLDLSETASERFRQAANCYVVNTAFYALFHAGEESNYSEVKAQSLSMIRDYRRDVLRDAAAPLKSKAACVLSMISMALTERIYHLLKR